MRYPDEIIEEVRQKNNIVDIVGSYVKLKKTGSNYMGLCPFHNEKSGSFSVSESRQMYHCFGCGVSGNVFTFLMEYENYTFVEALKVLAEKAGVTLPEREETAEGKRRADERNAILEINKEAATYYYYNLRNEGAKAAQSYLLGRKLTPETIKSFGLGFSGKGGGELYNYLKGKGYKDEILKESGLFTFDEARGVYDKFWNRVMFPIFDVNNRVIGFGGRVMGDGKPKYLNSPETKVFDKSRNLYGLNKARQSREKYMLCCEGYMDVISMHQAGFTNAVASLGTALTGLQAALLKRYTDTVILTYDSDEAGVKAALRAIPIFREAGITTKVLNLKPHKDPDEFIKNEGVEAFKKRIEEAENSFYFEIRVLEQNFDLNDPDGRTKFHNEMAKKLLVFTDEIERGNYIEALAAKYFISAEALTKKVNGYGAGYINPAEPARSSGGEDRSTGGYKKKKTGEEGIKESQRLLLTWLLDVPGLFDSINGIIDENDFVTPLYHTVAASVFEEYRNTGKVSPARIVSLFESKEEQAEAALLFNTTLSGEKQSKEELELSITETVKKVKKNSLDYESKKASEEGNMSAFSDIIKEQAKIQNIKIRLKQTEDNYNG
ncbi:MAG: DNA primase [Lachnospiraceae bacterium]|nr:DNA primase [Lachnospiraceae bacterium]